MRKKIKMDWILIFTILGVIAAWIPFLYERFVPTVVKGKMISMYDNVGTFSGEPRVLFLFKISVVSLNQSFDLQDIDIDIRFLKAGWVHASSINQRSLHFTLEGKVRKLNVPESAFLNNLAIIRKDEPVVGYICTTTPVINDDKITEIKFIFKSYSGNEKYLTFTMDSLDATKLHYDDSIWTVTDTVVK